MIRRCRPNRVDGETFFRPAAGLSNVAEARAIAPVMCVQNHYNVVHRAEDALAAA